MVLDLWAVVESAQLALESSDGDRPSEVQY